jgi:hypothetical protein
MAGPGGLDDNIDKLKGMIYDGDTASSIIAAIVGAFLPYEEIAKKIILLKNKTMSKEDADLMIDGPPEEDPTPEGKAAQFLKGQDKEKALNGSVNTDLKKLVFPLEGRLLEDEDDVEEEPIEEEPIPENETESQREQRIKRREERKEERAKKKAERKAQRQKQRQQAKENAKEKRDQFIEEAKKIVEDVKKALFKIISEQINLIKALIQAAVSFGVSIPAMAVMVAAPPWNVAAAIALVLSIIETLNKLAKRITDVVEYLDPLKQLTLLLPDEVYEIITMPLNIAVIILIGIYTPISALKKGIDSILAFLLKLISPGNLTSIIDKIKAQIRKKEKERDRSDDDEDIDTLNGEISDLRKQLGEIETGYDITFTEADLKKYTQTADIYEEIKSVQKLANDIVYVYDVKLPDGNVIRDLNLEQLEEIKDRYDVVFNNQASE